MTSSSPEREAVLLVANYESDVGYAWWLMENFWHLIATRPCAAERRCVLAYPKIGTIPELIRTSPIEAVEFNFAYDSWKSIRRGFAFIRKNRVSAVYLTDWPYLHWAYLVWRLLGVKRIVLHDHTPGDRPPLTGSSATIKGLLHSLKFLSATDYVAVSPYIATRMHDNGRVPRGRCMFVTNGIKPIDCTPVNRSAVRGKLGIPEDAVLIALVSRATYYKGLDVAVRCLARVLDSAPALRGKVYAVHCGDGPDLDDFTRLARELGVSDGFRFLGRRSDVRDILCSSDIAFHPSHGEAMSLAVLEFMSAGLAVLTSDLPSVCTAIEPGVTGVTYKHDDLEAAAAALRGLIEHEQQRRSLGAAAADSCRRNYTLDIMNRTFVEKVLPLFQC